MNEEKPKRGRPATDTAMTTAQRQRVSRITRKKETFETFPPMQISMMLSAEATQALRMLAYNKRDMSQKKIIEELLIEAYTKHKRDLSQ